jgi:hypothetical protein
MTRSEVTGVGELDMWLGPLFFIGIDYRVCCSKRFMKYASNSLKVMFLLMWED